jgi:hypothetical protein
LEPGTGKHLLYLQNRLLFEPLMIPAMAKQLVVFLLSFLAFAPKVLAQEGQGSLRIEYTTSSLNYEDDTKERLRSKSNSRHVIEMPITFLRLRDKKAFEWISNSPKESDQVAETVMQISNHVNRGENGMTFGSDIPVHQIQFTSHEDVYNVDPCDDNGGLFLQYTYDFSGPVTDGTIIDAVLSMAGDRSGVRFRSQSRGGQINSRFPFQLRSVEIGSDANGNCIHIPKDEVSEYGLNVNPPRTENRTDVKEENRVYRSEPAEIPIAAFAKYLEDPSRQHTFTASFSDFSDDGLNVSDTKGTITLILGKSAEGEIVVSMEGNYDTWYPTLDANLSPSKLVIKAELSDPKAEATKMRLTLGDVSTFPGIATNYPVDGASSLDMFFSKDQPAGLEWVDSVTVVSKDKVRNVTANITVRDYAANARLYAAAVDQSYPSKEKYGDLPFLQLPKDRDVNQVADAWEALHGLSRKSATWDNDQFPTGQKRQGDGYTLFEEYRGFIVERNAEYDGSESIVTGKHIRTDPEHKDLFVYDPDQLVQQYYEPSHATKLNIHYVTPKSMRFSGVARDRQNRVINTNSPKSLTYAPQYGLYIVRWTAMIDDGYTLGEASDLDPLLRLEASIKKGEKLTKEEEKEVNVGGNYELKNNYVVKVAANMIQKVYGAKNLDKMLKLCVTHEIGHAIGMPHHERPPERQKKKLFPDWWPALDEEEKPEDVPEESEGVLDCAMRYPARWESKHGLIRKQDRFCGAETFKLADPKTGAFIEVPAHNCFGQIDVKSDP